MYLIKLFFAVFFLLNQFDSHSQEFNPPFFVFEDGLWNARSDSTGYWAELVKEVGFEGMEVNGLDRIDEMITALDKHELQLFTIYIKIDLEKEQPYDPRLKDYIKRLRNTGLHLWVHVHSEKYQPSDPEGDEKCIEIISELAEYASRYGVRIAFYPHSNFWVEKVDDGVRLAKKIDMSNVGTVFNLCHFLKKDEVGRLGKKIKNAMPYLFLVSINGADDGDTHMMGWERLIQPLGRGDYDVLNLLGILKEQGYHYPIGLQCYNIRGRPEDFLKESMAAWEKYITQLSQ